MKHSISALFVAQCLLFSFFSGFAQTTVNSGNWNDGTIWSGSAVPAAGGTVTVIHPVTINTSLSPTGTWTFSSNTTDQPGGTAYTFNPNSGTNTITITAGITVTFEGATNQFNSGTIDIYGTLILGKTDFNNDANLKVNIKPGGTLIINGDLHNGNNAGTFTIDGALIVNGDFDTTGSVVVGGSGTFDTTGKLETNGGSTVFGTTNNCSIGPCSGATLSCTFTNTITPNSMAICTGTSTGTLTSNNNAGGTVTYQWLSSTDNVTYGNATGTSTASTYSNASLAQTTWYKVRVSSTTGPCTSTSAAMKVTVLPSGGWLGTTSNWGTASNWCSNSVPTNTTDVVISNAPSIANMPSVSTAEQCRSLTISTTYPTASSVTIAAGGTLSIWGDFTNNGTFTDNSTTAATGVKLVGSTQQTVAGTTGNVFSNLTIANSSGATPAINITTNNIAVQTNLTMTTGLINLNGYTITLGTAATPAASLGALAYSAGTRFYGGNIERWFPTTTVTEGTNASLFPIGSSADYRPIYFGSSGLTGSGGTIKVNHTATAGSSAVAFADGITPIQVRSNSFWTVTTANSIASTGIPINVRTEGTGFGTVGAVTDLRLTRATSASPGNAGVNVAPTTNPQVKRTGLTVGDLTNSFYWGSINSTQTPLPIKISSFTGRQVVDQIELNWKTSSELNFAYFSLGKSIDGITFVEIATIDGHGTTNEAQSYSFTDINPVIGIDYYRLKSVDYDGKTEYFKVIAVAYSRPKDVSAYPNPSHGNAITIQTNFASDDDSDVTIYNSLGKFVTHFTFRGTDWTEEFSSALAPGIYYATYSTTSFQKVIKFVVAE